MKPMIVSIVAMFLIGTIMGILANQQVRYRSFGLERNIMCGLFGAYSGGLLKMTGVVKGVLGIKIGGLIGTLIWALIGAAILLFVMGLFKTKARSPD